MGKGTADRSHRRELSSKIGLGPHSLGSADEVLTVRPKPPRDFRGRKSRILARLPRICNLTGFPLGRSDAVTRWPKAGVAGPDTHVPAAFNCGRNVHREL